MCSMMCNRMCLAKIVGEVFRRYTYSKNTNILNTCYANISMYTSNFSRETCWVNLCHFHACKEYRRGIHLSSASFCKDIPGNTLKRRGNPNKFGDLSEESTAEMVNDEGDVIEDNYVTYPVPPEQQLRIKQYADIIKQHIQNLEIEEAVDVLETRMIQKDRVQPDSYIYSLLISACGRFGHTRKAFQLYNGMKKRALKIPGAVYTALFNACANCTNPQDGLKRAIKLQGQLVEKKVELNSTHYHAMIKAYGRCKDLGRAFQVADFMIDNQMTMTEDVFNFLLQACISDKKAGFRHALWVWHKMLQKHVKPSLYTFNLMIRCVRDCELGEFEEMKKSLQQLTFDYGAPLNVRAGDDIKQLAIEDGFQTLNTSSSHKNHMVLPSQFLPDLLSPAPVLQCDISSLDLTKPHERFLLLGGNYGFMKHMAMYKVAPTIKTYTLLLDCIPPTITAEKKLMAKMRKDGIPIDTEFCNMLIKKRSFRFDYLNAEKVLDILHEEKLLPDIVTFGVLALACTNEAESRQLVRNMRQAGYRMNEEILGAMLKQGCIQHNFKYVTKILYLAKEESVKPSKMFKDNLQFLISSSRQILKKLENGEEVPASFSHKFFRKEFTTFMYKYQAWLKELNKPEDDPHSRTRVSQRI